MFQRHARKDHERQRHQDRHFGADRRHDGEDLRYDTGRNSVEPKPLLGEGGACQSASRLHRSQGAYSQLEAHFWVTVIDHQCPWLAVACGADVVQAPLK